MVIGDPLTLDAGELHSFRQDVSADLKEPERQALAQVKSRANFEAFIWAYHPQMTRRKVAGTPVFRVWFDVHGCVARAKLDIVPAAPDGIIGSTNLFDSVVRPGWQPQYSGVGTVVTPANTISSCLPVRRHGNQTGLRSGVIARECSGHPCRHGPRDRK